jgi:hypothetical protein
MPLRWPEVNYISNKVACVRTEYAGKAQGCPICGVDFRNTFHRYRLIVFPAFTSAPGTDPRPGIAHIARFQSEAQTIFPFAYDR